MGSLRISAGRAEYFPPATKGDVPHHQLERRYTALFASALALMAHSAPACEANFELDWQEFVALNGGPHCKCTEVISFVGNCDTLQAACDGR